MYHFNKHLIILANLHTRINSFKDKCIKKINNTLSNKNRLLKNKNNKNKLNSKYYLYYVTLVGLFRTIVYIFAKDNVGKVKVTDVAWNNPITREVVHSMTRLILMLMFFKSIIFGWGTTLKRKKDRDNLSIISFIFDLFLIIPLSQKLFIDKDSEKKAISTTDKAFVHRRPLVPFLIQLSTIVSAIFFTF